MEKMQSISFRYIFILPDKKQIQMDIHLDSHHVQRIDTLPDVLPEWTRLDFHPCPHCPLSPATHPHCPLAVHLLPVITQLDILRSHSRIQLKVIMENRTIIQDTTVQRGLSSLMGLITATSGCPHTRFFTSMARFHLPLADAEETLSRATSFYLLTHYFKKNAGNPADFDLQGLVKIYDNLHIVNTATAKRLRAATKTDSAVNALILLDLFTYVLPHSIETSLEEIRHLFDYPE